MDFNHGGMPQGEVMGFTVLEVLVTTAILAILTALTTPQLGALLPIYRLNSATRQVHSALHGIRSQAVAENISFQMTYSGGDPSYTITRDGTAVVTKSLPTRVVITAGGTISFTPRGTAAANRVRLQNAAGSCAQVVVSATGRIRICRPSQCNVDC